ncbi:hypothetical protein [Mycolicibacterium komossense]|uniref:Uncharacterized protein n=1 Tax=Mycolicibacterium komossense TaxID=1779 RepID=A0ABT3C9S3_9MYCO|nr:hypothetical protein [Mycolicibacterium komossense]MCV7226188.1 hypothetical protein [Mycolicibacterium komossense]
MFTGRRYAATAAPVPATGWRRGRRFAVAAATARAFTSADATGPAVAATGITAARVAVVATWPVTGRTVVPIPVPVAIAVAASRTVRVAPAGAVPPAGPTATAGSGVVIFRAAILPVAGLALTTAPAGSGCGHGHPKAAGSAHQQTASDQTADRRAPHP